LTIEHPAERAILCALANAFDPIIDEVFNPDYSEVIDRARNRVAAVD
jgi:hypothetical protein